MLKIVTYPNSVLRKKTEPVTVFDDELRTLIDAMTVAMIDDDGVGLAGPQVAVSKKLAVVQVEGKRYVLINPKFILKEGEQRDDEGCLSLPGVFGPVTRAEHVIVECQDETGEVRRHDVHGFTARAFQHEMDHLDGKLFIDHFSPMKREMVKKKLLRRV